MGSTHRILLLAILPGLYTCARAQTSIDAAERARIIEGIREAALSYDRNLPNFICIQVTHRQIRREAEIIPGMPGMRGGGRGGGGVGSSGPAIVKPASWEPVDSFEEQLTYFGHRESYNVLKVNGKTVVPGQAPPPGASSSGEFGSTLTGIFDPDSKTVFEWKRPEVLRGKTVNVFSFRIAQEDSSSQLMAGSERITVAYHGLIYADRETNAVLRVTNEAEIPKDFPLQHVTHILDYGPVTIAGDPFLVPLHSQMDLETSSDYMRRGTTGGSSPRVTLRNDADFRSYKRYTADAKLKPE